MVSLASYGFFGKWEYFKIGVFLLSIATFALVLFACLGGVVISVGYIVSILLDTLYNNGCIVSQSWEQITMWIAILIAAIIATLFTIVVGTYILKAIAYFIN